MQQTETNVKRKLDWEELFAKKRTSLKQGKDWTGGTGSFVQLIRTNASKRGVSVSVKELPKTGRVVVTVIDRPAKTNGKPIVKAKAKR